MDVKRLFYHWILPVALILMSACDDVELIEPPGIQVNMEDDTVIFAVIGDYGKDGPDEAAVAQLVKSWSPDLVITTGDNNYQSGEMNTIMENIADHYGDYVFNFDAEEAYRCNGRAFEEEVNRFFPSPGNHDTYGSSGMKPYLNFFTLPGNEVYYKFTWGDLAFFSLNSTASSMSEQEEWLKEEILGSKGKIRIVYFHHSPYSISKHGNERKMQLDFYGMGVDLVLTGHDHVYSRIEKSDEPGLTYLITGAGGKSLYECGTSELDEKVFTVTCNDTDFGAVRGIYDGQSLVLEYYTVSDSSEPFDHIEIFPVEK